MAPSSFDLLCLENPLLDIQGQGDTSLLSQYGLKLDDTLLVDADKEPEKMGLYDELINNRSAKLIPGGAAQNTARGAQYMLPKDSVWYVGSVGDDEYSKILREKCAEQGLHVEYHVDSAPTGKCGVVITDQHRTMLTHLAAANNYKLEHLKQDRIWDLVTKTKIFYVGGYHLTVCVPAAMALAKHAAETNKPFMLSLSAGFIPQFFKDQVAEIMPYCDYVFGNENEASTWAASNGYEDKKDDLHECAKLIATKPEKINKKQPRVVIITQGTDPTIVAVKAEGKDVEVKDYPVAAISPKEINDTNGAGDAFAGGFCAGVVQGKGLEECIAMGHWLARLSLGELGPSYPFPKQTYTSS
ncbi:Adenosine kinase [Cyphellophora attinorum]|uniref:Adenosine kinase n=1 Tax=Cyphellophora attinorum TaxID=1664694 RepID=A0A0N1HP71_9EURO|nr:Adenosine kinase [Phialophora attinorum]KPI36987.1 Adenosine kinase [Phialophora attinorum]